MMAYKHMSDLMDNLKVDLERRYNVKCRFVETTVPNNIRLVCQLIGTSDSHWLFTYCFNPVGLISNYNLIFGEIIIELEEKWMNRLYRV